MICYQVWIYYLQIIYNISSADEIVSCSCTKVAFYPSFSGHRRELVGSLHCTNFRLCFIAATPDTTTDMAQANALYVRDAYDFPLGMIDSIEYFIGGTAVHGWSGSTWVNSIYHRTKQTTIRHTCRVDKRARQAASLPPHDRPVEGVKSERDQRHARHND